jgi:hypothetical protein
LEPAENLVQALEGLARSVRMDIADLGNNHDCTGLVSAVTERGVSVAVDSISTTFAA